MRQADPNGKIEDPAHKEEGRVQIRRLSPQQGVIGDNLRPGPLVQMPQPQEDRHKEQDVEPQTHRQVLGQAAQGHAPPRPRQVADQNEEQRPERQGEEKRIGDQVGLEKTL